MGRVKDLLPENWDPYEGLEQEPSELEMLKMDAERASERVQEFIRHAAEGRQNQGVQP